jgi:hypothetical protein
MNGRSGPELGYASIAIITALFDKLVRNGVISRTDAADVADNALKTLSTVGGVGAYGGIRLIRDTILPKIIK